MLKLCDRRSRNMLVAICIPCAVCTQTSVSICVIRSDLVQLEHVKPVVTDLFLLSERLPEDGTPVREQVRY